MTTNDAAERLRERFGWGEDRNTLVRLLGQAMQAERRATVERIRKIALEVHHPDSWFIAQLDEEAAR